MSPVLSTGRRGLSQKPLPLTADQREAWVAGQALWGVSLHDALAHPRAHQGTFAWFSFPPQVWFDLDDPSARDVGGCLESIFAHEIGHHVLSPSTRQDDLKIRHQMARALTATGVSPTAVPGRASWCANVWSDMLINVRVAELQRLRDQRAESLPHEPEMIEMWRILSRESTRDRLWWCVMRAYEIVWSKPPGTLCTVAPPPAPAPAPPGSPSALPPMTDDARTAFEKLSLTDPAFDASLLADTVRTFGADPVSGALRFGMIAAPYFVELERAGGGGVTVAVCGGQLDARPATPGELVAVLADARMREKPTHPAADGLPEPSDDGSPTSDTDAQGYGAAATLELYASSDQSAVLSAWYQSEAKPWVKPLEQRVQEATQSDQSVPGPLDEWSIGDDFADIDWPATLSQGAIIVPGVTTRRRTELPDTPPPTLESVQLDLYIDSSGSMPSPISGSPAVLAGTVLLLSTFQGGGRARVSSFSGPGQVSGTTGFTRDRTEALGALTTFFGGGTTFPLDLYASRYRAARRSSEVRRHVVILSDDGLSSLFGAGQPGAETVAATVRGRLDTATLIVQDYGHSIEQAARAAGYDTLYIDSMSEAPAACAALADRLAAYTPGEARG
ncbi:hypothetical protein AX769_14560 [Frondihabitans sp. PAMC 28766]|uniref:hypothetical protein n=1 Tax=Frondihabitans sp. PAMC 28766 TaxID=1795630 RepID=UPI00078E2011|nr:hypothetical protein [Frondihabitans sp. PAMC 28766]AMM21136.1 hypothetical protein AX769_14560 [Frondihabitans sp. PAMC 28766]